MGFNHLGIENVGKKLCLNGICTDVFLVIIPYIILYNNYLCSIDIVLGI